MENRRAGKGVFNSTHETAIKLENFFHRTMGLLVRLGHRIPRGKESITPPQMRILQAVHMTGRAISMSSLASQLGLTKGTLTSTIKSLIKNGYLARARSDSDDRIVNISLAQPGKAMLHKIHLEMLAIFVKICREITEDERRKLLDSQQVILDTYSKVETRLANRTKLG